MEENNIPMAYTFDDILLIPQFSEIVPTEVATESFFARDINLNMPILSAAMDTVTEHKIAQIMAQMGGLGIIHKNMDIEAQAFEVERVKKYESGMIMAPITLGPDNLVSEALEMMRRYSISGVPITVKGKLVGILTNRDLRFETNTGQPISNLMTKQEKLVTAPVGTTLSQAKIILQKNRIEKLPVVDGQGMLKGLITIKDIEKAENFPQATKDRHGRLVVGAAIGVDATSRERAQALVGAGVDVLCVDTAHGFTCEALSTSRHSSPVTAQAPPQIPIRSSRNCPCPRRALTRVSTLVTGSLPSDVSSAAKGSTGADCIASERSSHFSRR